MTEPPSSPEALFGELRALMVRLRSPDGCPWDREQTMADLARYIKEEADEVVEAVAEGRPGAIAEELGDLPLLYNGQLLPVPEIAKFGFKVTIYSATLMAAYIRMRDAMHELKTTGSISKDAGWGCFEEMTNLLGVPEAMEIGKKYEN